MNYQITCPQCHQIYNQDNPPKTLINCNHSICLTCLQDPDQIICPLDRKRTQVRKYTISAFKTNELLLNKAINSQKPSSLRQSNQSNKPTPENLKSCSKKGTISQKIIPLTKNEKDIQVTEFLEESFPSIIYDQPSQIMANSPPPQQKNSPLLERNHYLSPKKQVITFDTCLLHSKKADLICMQDKCLICANCGLFGEHKHHKIIPYDTFLTQFSSLTEECFKNYEQLQSRQDKLNLELIEEHITSLMTDKRIEQVKTIKAFIKNLNNLITNLEKQLISTLDMAINFKKDKLLGSLCLNELTKKKDQYMATVQSMTEGLDHLFNLQNIQRYAAFMDPEHPQSYTLQEGQYLLHQIDNYFKMTQSKIEEEVSEFKFQFKAIENDHLNQFVQLASRDNKEITQLIQLRKKQVKTDPRQKKIFTPSRKENCKDTTILMISKPNSKKRTPDRRQEDTTLLLGSHSKENSKQSPKKQTANLSPIQPLPPFDQNSLFTIAPSPYLSVQQPPNRTQHSNSRQANPPRPRHKPTDSDLSASQVRPLSKSKSNVSNHLTERELLHVLTEKSDNKRRKKIDLPEKYSKTYEDLQKDKLEILDLGGAFLGDQNVLLISELFASRGRLKQVKLMNNKLTDDLFPELISRCRHLPSLNLSYNCLTEKSLEWLETEANHLGELRNITLSNNKIVLRNNKDRIEELKRKGINVSL